jgi:hypothetical protein
MYSQPKKLVIIFCKANPRIRDTIPNETMAAYQFANNSDSMIANMKRPAIKLAIRSRLNSVVLSSILRLISFFISLVAINTKEINITAITTL